MNTKSVLLSFFLSFGALFAFGQGCSVTVSLENYTEKTIFIAQHYGEKPYVMDSIPINAEGLFVYQSAQTLDPGMYFIVIPPEQQFIQFLLNANEQHISIYADATNLVNSVRFENASDSELFYSYLNFMDHQIPVLQQLQAQANEGNPGAQIKLDSIRNGINSFKSNLHAQNPESVTGRLLLADIDINTPDFEGSEEEAQVAAFYYRRNHFFDHFDLSDPVYLHSPVLHNKMDLYLNRMTAQQADSIIKATDQMLEKAGDNSENFQYLMIQFLNIYGQSNVLGLDRVFVHLVDAYCAKGLTPFIEEDPLGEILRKTEAMRPTLIGSQAPEITLLQEDMSPLNLYDIDAEYLVVFFWRPGCSTCQKSMPDVISFIDAYKDKGVKVLSVCTELHDKSPECWPYVKEKEMDTRFINTFDPKNQSRFYQKYDVRTTPKILILDKDKKILVNKLGAQQLGLLIDQYLSKERN